MDRRMKVLFIAGFGPITRYPGNSMQLYRETLGIAFDEAEGAYFHTEKLRGANTFAVWPLTQAAESCFGTGEWPENIPIPQAWLEFDVEDIDGATQYLKENGYDLLVSTRKEPWGQIVTRMLSPEGLLVGVTYTPEMRSEEQ